MMVVSHPKQSLHPHSQPRTPQAAYVVFPVRSSSILMFETWKPSNNRFSRVLSLFELLYSLHPYNNPRMYVFVVKRQKINDKKLTNSPG